MERSTFSAIGSFFTATLLAGTILLGGCSDSLTGTTPPDAEEENTTVEQRAQHNTNSTDTEPGANHNTTDED